MNTINLSVVICTMNRPWKLIDCLNSLICQTEIPSEVIIVDSSDKIFEGMKRFRKLKIKYIFKNLSMTQARNYGIIKSSGDVILFADDDAIFDKDYMENLMLFYRNKWYDNNFAGAEGLIVNENHKKIIERLVKFPFIPSRRDIYTVRVLHGCNMSFKKSIIEKYTFDENTYGYYADDDDVPSRISKKYRLYFVPTAKLVHNHTSVGGARTNSFRNYNTYVYNKFYIFLKSKSINHLISLQLGYFSTFIHIMLSHNERKHEAIKGMFYGFYRLLKSCINHDFKTEVMKS